MKHFKFFLVFLCGIVGALYGLSENYVVAILIVLILMDFWTEEKDRQISELKNDVIDLLETHLSITKKSS